jgi:6-phosphogluconolactonase (cycloisomerase 2 family)
MQTSPAAMSRPIARRNLLKTGTAFAAAGTGLLHAVRAEAQPDAGAMRAYVGAFTTPQRKAHGDGINVYQIDPKNSVWTHLQLLKEVNTSFLTIDRAQRFLYAVHADLDEVSAYSIDKQSGSLTALNHQSCGGKNPVHLSIDPSGRYIVTANYTAGSVGVVPIEQDGSLGAPTDVQQLKGEPGPNRKEQASSHPHNAVFDPSGRFIAVPDKGLDRIFVFRLDATSGKLVPNDPPFVATRAGQGPRHIAFHPSLPLAYVVNELGASVTTYRFDPERGTLEPLQLLPATPPSYTANDTGAEITVAPSGRFVYASNRGANSVAIFAVDWASGTLKPVGWAQTERPKEGETVRFITLDPAARILYAANMDSDTVVPFTVDWESGMLTPSGHIIHVNSPCAIVFAGT